MSTPPPRLRPRGLLVAAAVIGCTASAIAWLHPWLPWWAELPMHCTALHALLFALVGAGLAAVRAWRWAAVCATAAVLHALPALGWIGARPPAGDGPALRVLVANVLTSNDRHQALLDLVARERPDAVAVLEIDEEWLAALRGLDRDYPHRVVETRDDNFGIALWSRVPLVGAAVRTLGPFALPVIDARLAGDVPARLLVAHPPPPITGEYAAARDAMLGGLATLAAADPRTLLVGDLNCAPWTARLRALRRDGNLADSRAGFGSHATWPPGLGPLGIPIDHALHGPGLTTVERHVLDAIGSDHRPILVAVRAR